MASFYVDSNATGAGTGANWANAFTTLAGATAAEGAGDTIYIAHNHSETNAVALSYGISDRVKVICVNTSTNDLATTAVIETSGANNITLANSAFSAIYVYGITFRCGKTNTGTRTITLRGSFENCSFEIASTGSSSYIAPTGQWKNCNVKFAAAGQYISATNGFTWNGGGLASGSTSPTTLFDSSPGLIIENLDLSSAAASIIFCRLRSGRSVFRNILLPASWSGSVTDFAGANAPVYHSDSVDLHNSDNTNTNYRMQRDTVGGSVYSETSLVRTNGATDGTTALSHKFVSNASCTYATRHLLGPEIVKWNSNTGSAITVTVEILHDSSTNLKDDEVWIEVQYLGTSGYPQGVFISDAKASVVATAADQTTSNVAWTTTGMTNPNKQKLSVSFTPQAKGFIHARVVLAKASKTIYVDPKLTIT